MKNYFNNLNILILISTSIIIIYPILKLSVLIFPVDDAYIVIKQADHLIKGEFFQYSLNDEKVNACTSFILYITYSTIWFISNFFNLGKVPTLYLATSLIYAFNFILLILFLNTLKKIVLILFKENCNIIYFSIASIFTIPYIFFYGLETGLTIVLISLQFLFLLENRKFFFLLITVISSLNRPENMVLNFVLSIYIFFFENNFKKRHILLILISISLIPLLNYLNFSDIKTSSSSRVSNNQSFLNFLSPLNFYYFLISFFGLIPSDLIQEKFRNYFIFLKFSYLSIFLIIFLKASKRLLPKINKSLIDKINLDRNRSIIIILIIIIFYSALPFVFQARGEYGRYFLPIIPLFFIFIFKISEINRSILKALIFLNLSLLPILGVSHYSSVLHMKSLYHDNSEKLYENTSEKSVTALEVAGYPSLFLRGKIIDVYGLGTKRYADIHNDYNLIYEMIKTEQVTNFLAFNTNKKYYFDLGHFQSSLNDKKFKIIYSNKQKDIINDEDYLLNVGFYKVIEK